MENARIIETVGTITKKESLSTIEHETEKALVLESLKPYPGYNGTTIPDNLTPNSLFFVTDKIYSGETVIRATMEVKKKTLISFDATPGRIALFNTMNPCIRINNLQSYNHVEELIKLYREKGVGFKKAKKIEPFNGLIKIRKYFKVEQVDEGIYHDLIEPSIIYFEIPGLISWDAFESITLGIKPNVEYNNFDAALGVFFTPQCVIDFVRIYHKEIGLHEIKNLKSKYLEEISRLH